MSTTFYVSISDTLQCNQTGVPNRNLRTSSRTRWSFLFSANGCVMCVRPARSIRCPVCGADIKPDNRPPAAGCENAVYPKAFISLPQLILYPRRDEREANEYRGGNMSLQGRTRTTP